VAKNHHTLRRKRRCKCDLGSGNDFLAMTSKIQHPPQNIDKLDSIKIKNVCLSKDTIKKVKRQLT
jgi:hypothetical protein